MTYNFILGDCLEILKKYPDNHFDLTITSPPFKEEDVVGDYWEFYDARFKEIMRVTKNVVIIIHTATKLQELMLKYPPKRLMIWGKGMVKYSWRFNPILVYQNNEEYKVNKHIWTDVIGCQPIQGSRRKAHKYQDPQILYSTILKMFCKENRKILDPFVGSGTTAKACNNLLSLEYLGIECTGIDIIDYREVEP